MDTDKRCELPCQFKSSHSTCNIKRCIKVYKPIPDPPVTKEMLTDYGLTDEAATNVLVYIGMQMREYRREREG